jgi:YidC/Oxa1 family membrane protein insertase
MELEFNFADDVPPVVRLVEGGEPAVIALSYDDPQTGGRFELEYTFYPDEYFVRVLARAPGLEGLGPQLQIDLGPTLVVHEANPAEDQRALAYVTNHERQGINSTRLDAVRTDRVEGGPLHWVAIKNKYFVAAILQAGPGTMPFGGIVVRENPVPHAADLTATLQPGADGQYAYRIYLGPQEHQRLTDLGFAFQDVNPFGWSVFRPILRPLGHGVTWLLAAMHDALGVGYGMVLILFGVLIRVVLWPLNAKAMRSQLKSMELQPRMKDIQTRFKDKPEQLQKEMLRLYKEENFNPFGGCLPLLIPFPVLITLFFVFQSTIEFRGESFLWLPDLSRADPYYILPVALGLSMFLLQWISTRSSAVINPQMKMLMYFMPGVMVVIFLNFASGLNLYYASMNLASIPQQLLIMRERKRHLAAKGTAT